ncbi:MAG: lytic murein transglycosylase B [Gammaproteobacteria bacterium]
MSTGKAAPLDAAAIDGFVTEMQQAHAFDPEALRRLFGRAHRLDSVLAAISRPAEYKPWHQYRPIFITESRISGGVEFWRRHAGALVDAARRSGVPEAIIVAIIGVETAYGKNAGSYPVLDALGTLAFHYPPRAPFFRSELSNFLLLAREEGVDPATLKGSYAGAMGIPQFMPSSFRAYAVDFDGNGRRDIWQTPADAIGSVANYLQRHGWENARPVAFRAIVPDGRAVPVSKSVELERTLTQFAAAGIRPDGAAPGDAMAALLAYEGPRANEYWLGLKNFYVITRYNRSPKYALAVHQLAEEIRLRVASSPP